MSHTLVLKNSVQDAGTTFSITILSFQKYFGDQPDGAVAPGTQLQPGATTSITFEGGSGSGDYYSFSIYWTLGGGSQPIEYVNAIETRKRCDIESDDLESPSPVTIEFFSETFNVGTPVSDGCFNNSYSQITTQPA